MTHLAHLTGFVSPGLRLDAWAEKLHPEQPSVPRDLYATVYVPPRKASVTKKERDAARLWHQRWGFLCHKKEEEEKEALELGLSVDDYRAAIRLLRRSSEDRKCPVPVEACKNPLPSTSSGMVGRRVLYPLEKFGPLVKTSRNYPTRPPLPPGQVYDPYKQTMVFLGSVEGDPISHKQPPARCEATDMWAELPLAVSHFDTLHFGAK